MCVLCFRVFVRGIITYVWWFQANSQFAGPGMNTPQFTFHGGVPFKRGGVYEEMLIDSFS